MDRPASGEVISAEVTLSYVVTPLQRSIIFLSALRALSTPTGVLYTLAQLMENNVQTVKTSKIRDASEC